MIQIFPPPAASPEIKAAIDLEHLRIVSLLHFIYAGSLLLAVFSNIFVGVVILVMALAQKGAWDGPTLGAIIGASSGVIAMTLGALAAGFSGWALQQKKWRMASLVIGGLLVLYFPLGTVLGIVTILFLLKPAIIALYPKA